MNNICLIDLEISPAKGYFYPPLYETNILKPLDRQHLLSFAWQEFGSDTIHFEGVNTQSEKDLTQKLWNVLDKYPIIIAHNSDQFDIKMAKTFFILYKMKMPSPFKTVDTLKVARKHFKFAGNSLDQLADHFNLDNKIPHDKEMFIKCHENHHDKKAFKLLKKYNKKDVEILNKIYLRLRPYIDNHPNMNMYKRTSKNCPNCGSKEIAKRERRFNMRGTFQGYQCLDCGKRFQGEQLEKLKVIAK